MVTVVLKRNTPLIEVYNEMCEIFNPALRTEEFWFQILTQYIQNQTTLRYRPVLLRKLAEPNILEWYNKYVMITKEFVDERQLLSIFYEEFTMNDKVELFIERNRHRFEDITEPQFERKLFIILYRDLHDIAGAAFDNMTEILCYFGKPLTEQNYDVLLKVME